MCITCIFRAIDPLLKYVWSYTNQKSVFNGCLLYSLLNCGTYGFFISRKMETMKKMTECSCDMTEDTLKKYSGSQNYVVPRICYLNTQKRFRLYLADILQNIDIEKLKIFGLKRKFFSIPSTSETKKQKYMEIETLDHIRRKTGYRFFPVLRTYAEEVEKSNLVLLDIVMKGCEYLDVLSEKDDLRNFELYNHNHYYLMHALNAKHFIERVLSTGTISFIFYELVIEGKTGNEVFFDVSNIISHMADEMGERDALEYVIDYLKMSTDRGEKWLKARFYREILKNCGWEGIKRWGVESWSVYAENIPEDFDEYFDLLALDSLESVSITE